MGLEPAELARWTRFAAKGGIGKCVAQCDCVAESSDDLMFLKDDEITVLFQIPDLENFFLGYCEGVVGRFSGLDVKFLGRLKKPVMTKRASLGASSVSGVNAKSDGKSPTPSSNEPPSPAPYQPFPQRRESQERRRSSSSRRASSSLSPSRTLERRGSGPHPNRLTSPLSHSVIPPSSSSPSVTKAHDSDEERGEFGLSPIHPPPMSYSSTSTLSDSVVTTPAFAAFPLHAESQVHSSPRTTAFPVVIESSSSTSTADSEPPTRPSSPPDNSSSADQVLPAYKYTSNAPPPLKLGPEAKRFFPESNISPLRINKRIPTSPPVGASQISPYSPPLSSTLASSSSRYPSSSTNDSSQRVNDTHTSPPPPSAATPNTSHSFASSSSSYDHRSSADAQVGIGLSLLQDLANGMDSSDEEEDEGNDIRRRLRYSRWSIGKEDVDAAAFKATLGRVGHRAQDSVESQDGTVEGLIYARSEDDEHEETILQRTTLEAEKPSPIPFTTSPQSSPSNTLLSPTISPISPSFIGTNERERRPSLAPSADSAGSWEGASDIYDDYRYSRFSMASKMSMSSRFSVNAASGVTPTPPVPESRPSTDSGGSRSRVDSTRSRGGDSFRSRTDSARSRQHSPHLLPQVLEGDGTMEEDKQTEDSDVEKEIDDDGDRPLREISKRSTLMKDRTMSMDSEASVYTQNSMSSVAPLSLPATKASSRPAPLNLTQQPSPLLHTSWGSSSGSSSSAVGSGFVYLASSKSTSMLYTPVPGVVREGTADMAHVSPAPLPSPITPNFASAMRMKIEGAVVSEGGNPEVQDEDKSLDTTPDSSGLGNRIVVEDEDELPSRILNSSFNDTHSSSEHTPEASRSSSPSVSMHLRHVDRNISPSPSPEPVLQRRLAPLIIANRTPSPSPSVAETFPSEPPSPLVPSNPPPSGSSPTPSPTQILPTASSIASPTQPPSHLRPPKPNANGTSFPEQNRRRSLFLPHPNAPKSPGLVQSTQGTAPPQGQTGFTGPHPPQQYTGQNGPPPRPHLFGVIRMALSMPPRPPPPQPQTPPRPGQPPQQQRPQFLRGPTIYGRTEVDLGAANGPVPMIWSVDPPPPIRATAPPNGSPKPAMMGSQPRVPTAMVKPGQQARSMSIGPGSMALNANATANGRSGEKGAGGLAPGTLSTRPGSVQAVPAPAPPVSSASAAEQPSQGGVIPRANFFPKPAGLRPRSRSFSGFDTTSSDVPLPKAKSGDESEIPTARDVQRSLTTTGTSSNSNSNVKPTPATSLPHRPSPLSTSTLGGLKPLASSPGLKSPSSPLAQSVFVAPDTTEKKESPPGPGSNTSPVPPSVSLGLANRAQHQLRQVSSRATLNEFPTNASSSSSPFGPNGSSRSTPIARSTTELSPSMSSPLGGILPGRKSSLQVGNARSSSSFSQKTEVDSVSITNDSRSQVVISPPPIQRQSSLRTKLSLPNLRRKQSRNNTNEDLISSSASITGSQISHAPQDAAEMLQVKDMEFELVRPNFAHFQGSAARTSEDSGVLGREGSIDVRQDGYLRPESPTVSVSSGGHSSDMWPQPPTTTPPVPSRPTTESESSMEAHRNRELKWMSLMSSSPASQSRKSKKVKKLLLDGVPSSVRYLVWSYLTDGKARCVPGVYLQLCGRGRVPASMDIERDMKRYFQDQPHLQGTQGPVLVLLQAYLNMVPDIQYSMGLTLIVGQLLLLSPEEDAFWIFVSIMDTHIRPYFSPSTTQMEVDAALFSRALEANDPQVGRKVFVDMGVLPGRMCTPWFSTLFVGSLPPEYLNRIWDIFLFEGVPFLLRVALALVSCCRRRILESTSEESLLALLLHPPQSLLPATPEAFLSLTFSVKLKDDDMRKQRVKMEAQVKRQTQVPRAASSSATSGMISLPRS